MVLAKRKGVLHGFQGADKGFVLKAGVRGQIVGSVQLRGSLEVVDINSVMVRIEEGLLLLDYVLVVRRNRLVELRLVVIVDRGVEQVVRGVIMVKYFVVLRDDHQNHFVAHAGRPNREIGP